MTIELHVKGPGMERPATMKAAHLAWILQNMPLVEGAPPSGQGSEMAPYTMSTIRSWAGAAKIRTKRWDGDGTSGLSAEAVIAKQREIGSDRGLYMVGGCLMERTPEGDYANYISDVVDGGKALFEGRRPDPATTGVTAMGRPRFFMPPVRAKKRVPVYDMKYKRLKSGSEQTGKTLDDPGNGSDMAKQAREVMKGAQHMLALQSDELPGALTALFLAEVAREERMLPLGLMLLDLIEKKVEGFNWETMMTMEGQDIAKGGVRHPMVHDGAQKQANQMFEQYNDVTRHAVRILAYWLAHATTTWDAKVAGELKGSVGKLKSALAQSQGALDAEREVADDDSSNSAGIWRYCHEVAIPLLKTRAATLDMMLA